MKLNLSTYLYDLKHYLNEKLPEMQQQLDAAENAERLVIDWYESLTEDEYAPIAPEAERKLDGAINERRRLSDLVEILDEAIGLARKLDEDLDYLNNMGL